MAASFDRETLLDLVVNAIPLAIILFFVVGFAVVRPFGGDRLGGILMYVLLLAPFVALAVLTYISGKVILADERRAPLFYQGQAPMDDAEPREEPTEAWADTASGAQSSDEPAVSGDADTTAETNADAVGDADTAANTETSVDTTANTETDSDATEEPESPAGE